MNQLELFTRLVAIQITNDEGHTIKYLEPDDALILIQEYCERRGMWVYIDSYYVEANQLNTSILKSAARIQLNNVIVGG